MPCNHRTIFPPPSACVSSPSNTLLPLSPSRAFAFPLGMRTRLGPWTTLNSLRGRSLRGLATTFATPLLSPSPVHYVHTRVYVHVYNRVRILHVSHLAFDAKYET